MNRKRLLGISFLLACGAGCTTVDSAPPIAAQQVAPAPAVAYTEWILTPLDDPEATFVCKYEIPTGTRMREMRCRPTDELIRQRKEAQAVLGSTPPVFIGF